MAVNASDGSVVLSVDMNIGEAEKKLNKLTSDIEKQEKKIREVTKKRDEAQSKGVLDAAALDAEKAKLQQLKDTLSDLKAMSKDKTIDVDTRAGFAANIPAAQQALADQQVRVRELQAEYNRTENSVERYNAQIEQANNTLSIQRTQAGALAEQIERANGPAAQFGQRMREAGDGVDRLQNRIKRLASRVMVFSVITMALRGMRQWIGNVVKGNDEARKSMAQLKAALLTLVQPLVNVIIPAFIALVNVITRVVTAIASLVSRLFGTTIDASAKAAENLNKEQQALKGVGSEAKKASKQMASFDEINQIGEQDVSGSGTGSSEIAPDFSFIDAMGETMDKLLDKIEALLVPIGLVAAGFALWKISDMLPGQLGNISGKLAGIAIAIGGLIIFWDGLKDAWENGVDWVNMAEMIGGVALVAFGLYQAFGKIGGSIALVVGGIAMLVTGFKDAMKNGFNLENTLLSIAGLFATGLGITLMTGSFIPALIGAIAGLLLAITVATGHGEELIGGIKKILEGFKDFFTGIFTGDIQLAIGGIGKIFEGLKDAVGAVISGVRDLFVSFLDWLDEKTGGRFHGIIEFAKGFITGFFDTVISTASNFIDGVSTIFSGLTKFLSGVFTADWDMAWEGVKDIFKGVWNALVSIPEGALNLIIKGLNFLLEQINKIKVDIPEWVPFVGGETFGVNIPLIPEIKLPRLATGAVIPPNREFMAVLGDQKNGYNVEAPADLIRQIVHEEVASAGLNGSNENINIVFSGDLASLARVLNPHIEREKRRMGTNLVNGGMSFAR